MPQDNINQNSFSLNDIHKTLQDIHKTIQQVANVFYQTNQNKSKNEENTINNQLKIFREIYNTLSKIEFNTAENNKEIVDDRNIIVKKLDNLLNRFFKFNAQAFKSLDRFVKLEEQYKTKEARQINALFKTLGASQRNLSRLFDNYIKQIDELYADNNYFKVMADGIRHIAEIAILLKPFVRTAVAQGVNPFTGHVGVLKTLQHIEDNLSESNLIAVLNKTSLVKTTEKLFYDIYNLVNTRVTGFTKFIAKLPLLRRFTANNEDIRFLRAAEKGLIQDTLQETYMNISDVISAYIESDSKRVEKFNQLLTEVIKRNIDKEGNIDKEALNNLIKSLNMYYNESNIQRVPFDKLSRNLILQTNFLNDLQTNLGNLEKILNVYARTVSNRGITQDTIDTINRYFNTTLKENVVKGKAINDNLIKSMISYILNREDVKVDDTSKRELYSLIYNRLNNIAAIYTSNLTYAIYRELKIRGPNRKVIKDLKDRLGEDYFKLINEISANVKLEQSKSIKLLKKIESSKVGKAILGMGTSLSFTLLMNMIFGSSLGGVATSIINVGLGLMGFTLPTFITLLAPFVINMFRYKFMKYTYIGLKKIADKIGLTEKIIQLIDSTKNVFKTFKNILADNLSLMINTIKDKLLRIQFIRKIAENEFTVKLFRGIKSIFSGIANSIKNYISEKVPVLKKIGSYLFIDLFLGRNKSIDIKQYNKPSEVQAENIPNDQIIVAELKSLNSNLLGDIAPILNKINTDVNDNFNKLFEILNPKDTNIKEYIAEPVDEQIINKRQTNIEANLATIQNKLVPVNTAIYDAITNLNQKFSSLIESKDGKEYLKVCNICDDNLIKSNRIVNVSTQSSALNPLIGSLLNSILSSLLGISGLPFNLLNMAPYLFDTFKLRRKKIPSNRTPGPIDINMPPRTRIPPTNRIPEPIDTTPTNKVPKPIETGKIKLPEKQPNVPSKGGKYDKVIKALKAVKVTTRIPAARSPRMLLLSLLAGYGLSKTIDYFESHNTPETVQVTPNEQQLNKTQVNTQQTNNTQQNTNINANTNTTSNINQTNATPDPTAVGFNNLANILNLQLNEIRQTNTILLDIKNMLLNSNQADRITEKDGLFKAQDMTFDNNTKNNSNSSGKSESFLDKVKKLFS